ncbi:MAG: threonine-phosphate decarboxylase CobD [Candidatus Brocadia sp.]|uniref:threonine-phosphate decarboxylase n=1 Tax=Candidatus Brocadia fulgida TaxID=380242 RepID=A0A0M2UU30_9BACT|nr:MAG: L-threonine-O-3-phosphate decarboxylase CbiB [Candidatus Brocadia fulgida]UJS20712.1 MAG: threonine-phosphate decarboxylase CobD [Candidatus Brocadia sp.]
MFHGHGGNITHLMNQGNNGILDFSASINPLGYPQKVREVIQENFDDILHYPDIDCAALRKYIARKIGHSEDEIIVGNGSTELFYLIPRALRPAKGIVFQPTFSEFAEALKSTHTEVLNIMLKEEDNFCFTGSACDFYDKKAEIAFFCNPNNPTGQLVEKAVILDMAQQHPHTLFVVDEAFIDFVDEPERYSVINETITTHNLIVVRSLTKFYGFPGIRIGYLAAHADLVKKMMAYKEPWSVNTLAQYAAMTAMEDGEFISRSRRFMFQERSFLFHELSGIHGLSPYEPTANYLFIKIKRDGVTSSWLRGRLLDLGIAIRDCSNFTGLDDTYFRVAVRTREENMRLIAALKKVTDHQ